MEMQLEYFDALANAQKQALTNLVTVQKDLRTQWLDAMSKIQSSLNSIPGISGIPETPEIKEVLNQSNHWFDVIIASTKTFSDQSLRSQENWNTAFEMQLDINREGVKDFLSLAKTKTTAAKANKA